MKKILIVECADMCLFCNIILAGKTTGACKPFFGNYLFKIGTIHPSSYSIINYRMDMELIIFLN